MKKTTMYRYLGVNGVIDSPVLLEGIHSIKTIRLVADDGYVLTKDGKTFVKSVSTTETDADAWQEVKGKLS